MQKPRPEWSSELFQQVRLSDPRVAYRDLSIDDPEMKRRLLDAVDDVLTSGQLLMGPRTQIFEERMAEYCGRKFCVGTSSGTDALYLAFRALDIGPGDEVITTPISWVATASTIAMTGARPIFADVGRDQNIDPACIEALITERTKAIVPVHFTGRLCDMDAIMKIAAAHDLLVIEDAAQAFGAATASHRAGSAGHCAAFSLNPMKVLPGFGEAGAVVTDDEALRDRMAGLRYLGTQYKEICLEPALNAKMDEMQAAMLLVSLDYVDPIIDARIRLANRYSGGLAVLVECPLQVAEDDRTSVMFDYQIFCDRRDELRTALADAGVETKVKHPILLPDQPAFASDARAPLPVADELVGRMISLPIHEKMSFDDVDYVIQCIADFYAR